MGGAVQLYRRIAHLQAQVRGALPLQRTSMLGHLPSWLYELVPLGHGRPRTWLPY